MINDAEAQRKEKETSDVKFIIQNVGDSATIVLLVLFRMLFVMLLSGYLYRCVF